jgi:hypothetical protein
MLRKLAYVAEHYIAYAKGNGKEQNMARQVSKPNIFWAPSLETARKIDDEDTVKPIETARYRFAQAWPILNAATMNRQAGFARHSLRKLPRFTK